MLNGPTTSSGFRAQYDVSHDGQRFLLSVPVEEATSSLPNTVVVVLDWAAGLKK